MSEDECFEATELLRAKGLMTALMTRTEPLVKQIAPSPGSRAVRFVQLLSPDLHAFESAPATPAAFTPTPGQAPLGERVAALEAEVASLRESLHAVMEKLGRA